MNRADELFYFEGEKPVPLTVNYRDVDNVLKASTLSGASLVAKAKIDDESETDISMTNNGDGSMTIDWSTVTSDFVLPTGRVRSNMRIDIQVTSGSYVWYLPRFSIPIIAR